MESKTYACQATNETLAVTNPFDRDDELYLRIRAADGVAYAHVYLSRKQVKKLRKQLKEALET